MRHQIQFTQVDSTPALGEYVVKKIVDPLERYALASGAGETWNLKIELGRLTQHHRKGDVWFADVTGPTSYGFIRVHEEASSIHEAIDLVEDELRLQLMRSKGRIFSKSLRAARRAKKMMRLSRLARFFRRGRIRDEGI